MLLLEYLKMNLHQLEHLMMEKVIIVFLITHGKLREGLFLIDCKNITEEIAVVPNVPSLDEKNETIIESKKGFLVVSNKDEWKDYFSKYICTF